jgi:hypothetical protein
MNAEQEKRRDNLMRLARMANVVPVDHFYVSDVFLEKFAALVAAEEQQACKEMIAAWVEDWCEGLSAKKIAECIRGDGNDTIKPNKYVTRTEPL